MIHFSFVGFRADDDPFGKLTFRPQPDNNNIGKLNYAHDAFASMDR
jgi:hypothetical protein